MDQSELEENACNRCQARENTCERGTIGFGFASHWLRNWREFLQNVVKQNQSKRKITFDTRLKTALIQIELKFGNVGYLGEGKNRSTRRKPLGERTRTNNKLNLHDAEFGNQNRDSFYLDSLQLLALFFS